VTMFFAHDSSPSDFHSVLLSFPRIRNPGSTFRSPPSEDPGLFPLASPSLTSTVMSFSLFIPLCALSFSFFGRSAMNRVGSCHSPHITPEVFRGEPHGRGPILVLFFSYHARFLDYLVASEQGGLPSRSLVHWAVYSF